MAYMPGFAPPQAMGRTPDLAPFRENLPDILQQLASIPGAVAGGLRPGSLVNTLDIRNAARGGLPGPAPQILPQAFKDRVGMMASGPFRQIGGLASDVASGFGSPADSLSPERLGGTNTLSMLPAHSTSQNPPSLLEILSSPGALPGVDLDPETALRKAETVQEFDDRLTSFGTMKQGRGPGTLLEAVEQTSESEKATGVDPHALDSLLSGVLEGATLPSSAAINILDKALISPLQQLTGHPRAQMDFLAKAQISEEAEEALQIQAQNEINLARMKADSPELYGEWLRGEELRRNKPHANAEQPTAVGTGSGLVGYLEAKIPKAADFLFATQNDRLRRQLDAARAESREGRLTQARINELFRSRADSLNYRKGLADTLAAETDQQYQSRLLEAGLRNTNANTDLIRARVTEALSPDSASPVNPKDLLAAYQARAQLTDPSLDNSGRKQALELLAQYYEAQNAWRSGPLKTAKGKIEAFNALQGRPLIKIGADGKVVIDNAPLSVETMPEGAEREYLEALNAFIRGGAPGGNGAGADDYDW